MCDAMSVVSLSCQCVSEQCVIVFSDRHRHYHRGVTRGTRTGKPQPGIHQQLHGLCYVQYPGSTR